MVVMMVVVIATGEAVMEEAVVTAGEGDMEPHVVYHDHHTIKEMSMIIRRMEIQPRPDEDTARTATQMDDKVLRVINDIKCNIKADITRSNKVRKQLVRMVVKRNA